MAVSRVLQWGQFIPWNAWLFDMFTVTDILLTSLVPCFAAMLAGSLLTRTRLLQDLVVSISTAVGFGIGKLAIDARDFFNVQPADASFAKRLAGATLTALDRQRQLNQAQDWLVALGLLSSLVLGMLVIRKNRNWFYAAAWIIALLLTIRLLWGSVYFVVDWSRLEAAFRVFGIAGCLALPICLLTDTDATAINRRWLLPIMVWLGLLASSMTFMLTGSKTYGELGGLLSFAFLGSFLVTLVVPRSIKLRDLHSVAVLLGGLMLLACAFSATAVWQVICLALGMTLSSLLLGKMESVKTQRRLAAIVIFLVATVPVVAIAAWRFAEATKVENPYSQYK